MPKIEQYAAKLEIHPSFSGGTRYLVARVSFIRPNGSPVRSYDGFDNSDLEKVFTSGQADNGDKKPYFYGYAAEYFATNQLTLDVAQDAARILAKIDKRLKKLDVEFGRAENFAEFAVRLCNACGVSLYLRKNDTYAKGYITDLGTLREDIASALREFEVDNK